MKLSHVFLLSISLLSFQSHAMDAPDDLVEHVYDHKVTYSPGIFNYFRDGNTLSAPPCLPQKVHNQKGLIYDNLKGFKESALYKETSLYKVIPGQDGRKHISNTTTWPHCINTKLKMIIKGHPWGGSGTMVGPHHVLTCGHCVYDSKEKWFDEIFVYPALNGELPPFGKFKVTKAYIFKSWLKDDPDFDIALLLLDQSIGECTGWGGLLSVPDAELSPEEINITGYPGDKGFKQMWGMSHKIKTMTSEKIHYEHDTQGGQSGCAISIKKHGMPFVVGVHTNGCGYAQEDVDSMSRNTPLYGRLTNSGVRLSGKKFTDLLLKIIPATYTLNSEGSLSITPNLTPKIQPSDLREREKFAIRESMIDECITQYKILISPNLKYQELLNVFNDMNNACSKRMESYNKLQDPLHWPLLLGKDSSITKPVPRERWDTYGIKNAMSRKECQGPYEFSYTADVKKYIMNDIREDVIEGMALYRKLYGCLHPRWEEFSNLIPEVSALNKAPILSHLSVPQKIQPSLPSPREKREIFVIRETMVDECINQYKKIINTKIPYTELVKVFDFLIGAYTARIEYAGKLHSETGKFLVIGSLKITEAIRLVNVLKAGERHRMPQEPYIITQQPGATRVGYITIASIQRLSKIIQEDVLESMEIYKELYGKPHPRWDEFNKM